MPHKSSNRGQGNKDSSQIAYEVSQKAIGEISDQSPADLKKNPAAVALGCL